MNAESLSQAVKSGDLAQVQRILKHNPNIEVDALGQYSRTPLLRAIDKKQKPIIEVLLAHGAAVNGPVGASRKIICSSTPWEHSSSFCFFQISFGMHNLFSGSWGRSQYCQFSRAKSTSYCNKFEGKER